MLCNNRNNNMFQTQFLNDTLNVNVKPESIFALF